MPRRVGLARGETVHDIDDADDASYVEVGILPIHRLAEQLRHKLSVFLIKDRLLAGSVNEYRATVFGRAATVLNIFGTAENEPRPRRTHTDRVSWQNWKFPKQCLEVWQFAFSAEVGVIKECSFLFRHDDRKGRGLRAFVLNGLSLRLSFSRFDLLDQGVGCFAQCEKLLGEKLVLPWPILPICGVAVIKALKN